MHRTKALGDGSIDGFAGTRLRMLKILATQGSFDHTGNEEMMPGLSTPNAGTSYSAQW